jgi:hypothetical protein
MQGKHETDAAAAAVSIVPIVAAQLCGWNTCSVGRCQGVMLCLCHLLDVVGVVQPRNACSLSKCCTSAVGLCEVDWGVLKLVLEGGDASEVI